MAVDFHTDVSAARNTEWPRRRDIFTLGAVLAVAVTTVRWSAARAQAQPGPLPASIGAATMEANGTLVLMLRGEGPGGMIGEARISVAPSDPLYADYLRHIGGLRPGETKPVPPWPDTDTGNAAKPDRK